MNTYLSELFSSIQGEGPFIGERHFFIRFSGCHRKCIFCDTNVKRTKKISIEKKPGSGEIEYYPNPISSSKILDFVNLIDNERNCKKVSITGGEPLLQYKFLKDFLPKLKNDNRLVYLETSGDLTQQLQSIIEWIDFASVDIKLSSVTNEKNNFSDHWQFLKILKSYDVEFYTKIIISNDTDEEELVEAVKGIHKIAGKDLMMVLQPMSETESAKNVPSVTNLLMWQEKAQQYLNNVRIIPQTHKMLEVL